MNIKIRKIFLIIALIFGSLLLVSFRDVFAASLVVIGVEDNTYYNASVTITFDEAKGTVTATLNTTVISFILPQPRNDRHLRIRLCLLTREKTQSISWIMYSWALVPILNRELIFFSQT